MGIFGHEPFLYRSGFWSRASAVINNNDEYIHLLVDVLMHVVVWQGLCGGGLPVPCVNDWTWRDLSSKLGTCKTVGTRIWSSLAGESPQHTHTV